VSAEPTFSVIMPTKGRETLVSAFASVASQLRPGDEVLVVCSDAGDFGNSARNDAIERARGSHLVFLDDDDEYLPGALDAMRSFAAANPRRVGLFRLRYHGHGDTGAPKNLADIGTPMLVVPNVPGKVGRFGPADTDDPLVRAQRPGETREELALRFSDYEFIRSTLAQQGGEPVTVPTVTAVVRPERNRWRRLRYRIRARSRLRAMVRRQH
jgi:glycosyltransferase involved in cell wall biosynthesis